MNSLRRRLAFALVAAAMALLAAGAVANGATKHKHSPPHKKIGPLSGTWSGQYSGTFSGSFTLKWTETGSKLSGTIDLSPGGTMGVNGSVSGSSINFGTVGSKAIKYNGSISGGSMSGNYTTPAGGGSWSATKK